MDFENDANRVYCLTARGKPNFGKPFSVLWFAVGKNCLRKWVLIIRFCLVGEGVALHGIRREFGGFEIFFEKIVLLPGKKKPTCSNALFICQEASSFLPSLSLSQAYSVSPLSLSDIQVSPTTTNR